jgi:hypothetical protein
MWFNENKNIVVAVQQKADSAESSHLDTSAEQVLQITNSVTGSGLDHRGKNLPR